MFDQSRFTPVSAQANSNAPRFWSYDTPDTKAQVLGNQYFEKKVFQLQDGDVIFAKTTDGEIFGRFVSEPSGFSIKPLSGAGSSAGQETVIEKLEDFVNYDDDFVFIGTDTSYRLVALVDIGARVLTGPGIMSFSGGGGRISGIISTATSGALLNTVDSLFCFNVSFTANSIPIFNATGDDVLFNIRSTALHGGRIGSINLTNSNLIFNLCEFDSAIDPLVIDGSYCRIEFEEVFPEDLEIAAGETFVTLAATATVSERFLIARSFATIGATGVYLNVLDKSGLDNEGLQISGCTFRGPGGVLAVTGIDETDNEAFFISNVGLASSVPNSGWTITGNALATTINTIGVYESINTDNSTESATASRFSFVFPVLTSTGAKARAYLASCVLVLETIQTNQRVSGKVFINDVATDVGFSATTTGSASNRVENLSVNGAVPIFPGDTVELKIANLTSTDNIIVQDAFFQLVSVSY